MAHPGESELANQPSKLDIWKYIASTRHWGEWTCQTAFKAWRSALNSTRPGETIIYHYKPDFFSWNISRCGGQTPPSLFEIFQFLPPPPPTPLKGGYIYITQKNKLLTEYVFFLSDSAGSDRVIIKKTFIEVEDEKTPTGLPATYNSDPRWALVSKRWDTLGYRKWRQTLFATFSATLIILIGLPVAWYDVFLKGALWYLEYVWKNGGGCDTAEDVRFLWGN